MNSKKNTQSNRRRRLSTERTIEMRIPDVSELLLELASLATTNELGDMPDNADKELDNFIEWAREVINAESATAQNNALCVKTHTTPAVAGGRKEPAPLVTRQCRDCAHWEYRSGDDIGECHVVTPSCISSASWSCNWWTSRPATAGGEG